MAAEIVMANIRTETPAVGRMKEQTVKTLIIVPVYNEEKSIPGVIRDLRENVPHADIVIIDDGSTDRTTAIAADLGVIHLKLPFNLGIGGAVQAGYRYAQNFGYDVAIQFDGDGQHIASEIPVLVRPVEDGIADISVGSRFLIEGGYNAPVFRKIGIWIFSGVLSRILGRKVTDTTSGFRACNRKTIEFFSHTYPDDYPEVESLVLLHRAGLNITERAIKMRDRTGGRSSITPVRSIYYMVKVLLAIAIDLMKKR